MTGHVAEGNPETRLEALEERLTHLETAPKPTAAKNATQDANVTAKQLTDSLESVRKEISNLAGDVGRLVERLNRLEAETTKSAPTPRKTAQPAP